jgi:hypothetical protein
MTILFNFQSFLHHKSKHYKTSLNIMKSISVHQYSSKAFQWYREHKWGVVGELHSFGDLKLANKQSTFLIDRCNMGGTQMNDKSGQKKVASMKSLTYSITCRGRNGQRWQQKSFCLQKTTVSCVYLCFLYLGLLEMGVAKCTACCQEWVKKKTQIWIKVSKQVSS